MASSPGLFIVSTYPPRQCGLATFAYDLASALAEGRGELLREGGSISLVAMCERQRRRLYGNEVRAVVRGSRPDDYVAAADLINGSSADVVSLQHEYGIFGGRAGRHVVHFLERLAKPVVTTLHTVLAEPKPKQRDVLVEVCAHSAAVVVQAEKAAAFLADIYGVRDEKVHVIHHGTPDVPFADAAPFKKAVNVEGRKVVLTFGLISPRKGIQVAVRALADVLPQFPESLYVILGATHPTIKKRYGEAYRASLQKAVDRLGMHDHVRFVNSFVSLDELLTYLRAADVYVTPYLNEDQISSGTLAYAVACGKAIISTPYWYARELLGADRGILVPFRDWRTLAFWLAELLAHDGARRYLGRRAYRFGRRMTWPRSAAAYERLFRDVARGASAA
ncbi:MAG: glycosyltransferase [candidate division Zixibacteria bacterium]|nr:glycosyltransferase [candidate division Zixibacteria bacterium]